MTRIRRGLAAVTLVAATTTGAAGCGFHGIYSLPLPGAVANGGHTYTVGVQFADVLDLVPYSSVKVNGATVGHVKSVSLQHGHALVQCQLLDSVRLPQNTVARVEQTSILGEKFVELEAPKGQPPVGRLADGDLIGLSRTNTDASVEEVLGALSALLNGGGVQQIRTIAREVSTALHGRTGVARDLLVQLRDFAAGLDGQKQQILRAISGVDALARTVRGQEGQLVGALNAVPPALQVLSNDRRQLTTMLTSVARLGHVGVRVINASQQSLLTNLRNLQPTLDKLSRVGRVIPKTLGILITYPTADSVEQEYFGDYGNLSLTIDLSKGSLATFLQGLQVGSAPGSATPTSARHSTGGHKHAPAHKHRHHRKHPIKKVVKGLLNTITHVPPGSGIGGLLLGGLS